MFSLYRLVVFSVLHGFVSLSLSVSVCLFLVHVFFMFLFLMGQVA